MRTYAIIGLSSFGFFIAKELAGQKEEVMAIDLNEEKIERIKPFVQKAVIADGSDYITLQKLGLADLDVVIVSLGGLEASVLATLHLKKLKVKRILAKALSEDHGNILQMVGATQVVFPEKDEAIRTARTLTSDNVLDHVPLSDGYSIIEIAPPASFLHKSLGELNLRNKYGIQVIVIKQLIPENIIPAPNAEYQIRDSDVLVIMGRDNDLKKLQGR